MAFRILMVRIDGSRVTRIEGDNHSIKAGVSLLMVAPQIHTAAMVHTAHRPVNVS